MWKGYRLSEIVRLGVWSEAYKQKLQGNFMDKGSSEGWDNGKWTRGECCGVCPVCLTGHTRGWRVSPRVN